MRRYYFGMNELRKKRKELGITQIQAAKACGISRRTYQTYEETNNLNATYDELVRKLDEMGVLGGNNYISNPKYIRFVCNNLFKEKYPEIKCAFLFGSYARGDATGKSDIDIMAVCPPMGMRFYGIAAKLEEQLHKPVDLHTHRELLGNETLLVEVLKEGIKIYG